MFIYITQPAGINTLQDAGSKKIQSINSTGLPGWWTNGTGVHWNTKLYSWKQRTPWEHINALLKEMIVCQTPEQSCDSMHFSTPCRSSITRCPTVHSLERTAQHRSLVPAHTDPRCRITSSLKHVSESRANVVSACAGAAGARERVCIPAARLSDALLRAPVFPSSSFPLSLASTRRAKQIAGWHERRRVLSRAKLS